MSPIPLLVQEHSWFHRNINNHIFECYFLGLNFFPKKKKIMHILQMQINKMNNHCITWNLLNFEFFETMFFRENGQNLSSRYWSKWQEFLTFFLVKLQNVTRLAIIICLAIILEFINCSGINFCGSDRSFVKQKTMSKVSNRTGVEIFCFKYWFL